MIPDLRLDPDNLHRSAKYISRTYELLSEKLHLHCAVPLPVTYFVDEHPFGSGNEANDG